MGYRICLYSTLLGLLLLALAGGEVVPANATTPVGTEYQADVTNFPSSSTATLRFDGSRKPIGTSGVTISERLTPLGSDDWVEFSLKTENGQPFVGQQTDPLGSAEAVLTNLLWGESGTPRAVKRNTMYLYFSAEGKALPMIDPRGVGWTFISHPFNPDVMVVRMPTQPTSTDMLSLGTADISSTPVSLEMILQIFLSPEDTAKVDGITFGFAAVEDDGSEPPPPPPPPPPDDNQPPEAEAGDNQTVEANQTGGAQVLLAGSGSDPDEDPLTFTWTGPFGTANGATPTVTLMLGNHELTLTVEDGRGGSATDTVMIEVADTTAPTLTVPADAVLEATGPSGTTHTFDVSAEDIADPAPSIVCNPTSGSTFPLGMTTVTCTATDLTGNQDEQSFQVTVQDTTPPVVTAPPDVTVPATGALTAVNLQMNGPPTATDAVGVVLGPVPDNPGPFAPGIHTVTWHAEDAAGNRGEDQQTVSVLFTFSGFFPPVDALPSVNTVKAGQGVAMKWQLSDGSGGYLSDPTLMTGTTYTLVACDAGSIPENPVETTTTGQSGLHFDPDAQQYVYVWATPRALAGQCADFIMSLSDGTMHRARFVFR